MNLSLSPKKCEFFMNVGTILGHSISKEWIEVDPNKISIINGAPIPKKERDVRILLGLDGYYRRFIKYFSKLASPLFGQLVKDLDFCWKNKCQEDFEVLN